MNYAIVTGGSHGIGLESARILLDDGYDVIIISRDIHKLSNAYNELNSQSLSSTITIVEGDASNPETAEKVKSLIDANVDSKVSVLINNVGGGGRWGKEIPTETPIEVWNEVYKNNMESAIIFTMMVLPYMIKNKFGRIITIASVYGKEGGGRPWFNSSKAAQIGFMKSMSMNTHYTHQGITFNTVSPGPILIPDTGWGKMYDNEKEKFDSFVENNIPVGFMGTAEDVAEAVLFLVKSKYINGANITIDGGMSKSY